MKTYQIYCDRGNGNELDGCWGSEHARFDSREEAEKAAKDLEASYPDCAWNVVEEDTQLQINDLVIRLSDGVEALVVNPNEDGKIRVRFDDDEEGLYSIEELAAYEL
jgi:hypothetical protein